MFRILFLFLLLSTAAYAADRVIINPEQDGDLKLKVNYGGVVTTPLQITGSTSNVQANLIDGGSLIIDGQYSNSSTNNHFLKVGRGGQAVQATIGYIDSPVAMYVGTTTNHPMHFRTNNTQVGDVGATGAWTLGPSGGFAAGTYNKFYGATRFQTGNPWMSIFSDDRNFIGVNTYVDSAGTNRASVTSSGYTYTKMDRQTGATSPVLQVVTNSDAQTADSAMVTTNEKTVHRIDLNGAHTIGPTGGTAVHTINGPAMIIDAAGSIGWRLFGLGAGAGAGSRNIATVTVGLTNSEGVVVSCDVTQGSGSNADVLYHIIISADGAAVPVFNASAVSAEVSIGGGVAPTLTWSGAGNTRTLVAGVAQLYTNAVWECKYANRSSSISWI